MINSMYEHVFVTDVDGQEKRYSVTKEEWEFHTDHIADMASSHLGGPLDLSLMPFNPIGREDQRLNVTHHEANPAANLEIIRMLGERIIGPKRVDEFISAYRARPDLMDARRMDIERGLKTGLVTNHRVIHDIAVVQALELLALGQERYIPRSALIMSKLITRFEVDTGDFGIMPATDVLAFTGRSYFSIPKTKSSYHALKGSRIADHTNPHMLEDLYGWLEQGGARLAVAGSGSTDRDTHGVITMQRINSGTARLFADLDRILPIAVDLLADEDKPWFSIGRYTDIARNDPEAAHFIMEGIGYDLSRLIGKPVQYEATRYFDTDEFEQAKARFRQSGRRIVQEFAKRRDDRRKKRE